ncbi:MAG: phenylalanine--tRNA ligase subunit beta [Alphaproteobacteria bacterium]|nr:phenylalanine--tRNA ligase subunit beta [Alphaproteobacteria bacterium]
MKFTFGWLKEHLDTKATLGEVTDTLTALGLEVEDVQDRAAGLENFVVAEIKTAEAHPDADKLRVCIVDNGSEEIQVVCGAHNARAGLKGVFAPAGTHIPGTGIDLKKAKIRGVDSAGMMCSALELQLGEDHSGIIELETDSPLGSSAAEALGLADPVIDIAITPNRGDCLGVHGIARDLAAAGVGDLKPLMAARIEGAFKSPIGITLDFTAETAGACRHFIGRYIRGVKNVESPAWLKEKLLAVGLRPISALVDITNYFTLDRCRPLHVFDADTVAGDLTVRLSRNGETLAALDGNAYELDDTICVIADDDRVLSLGGVMGGASTACTENTVNVLVEAALFDPIRTAATGRKLGIDSDARYRFERGVDPASTEPGIEAVSQLILDICGGEASELVIAGAAPEPAVSINFAVGEVARRGGLDVTDKRARDILIDLGFEAKRGKGALKVTVPSWRADVTTSADLVEEVLRVEGYDKIPAEPLPRPASLSKAVATTTQRRSGFAKRVLASRGLVETVTFSFVAADRARLFGGGDEELRLENPISSELTDLRPSILPALVAAAGRNADRGFADLGLFEVGPVYGDASAGGQALVAGGIRAGAAVGRHWAEASRPVDAYDAKADATAVLGECGMPVMSLQTVAEAPPWYHPGRSGSLRLGPKNVLALFGEIHPGVLAAMDVAGPMVGFEVMLDNLPLPRAKARSNGGRARPALELSPYQAVSRDFAFVIDEGVNAEALVRAVKGADKDLISDATVFDVYSGAGIGDGKRSVAIAVTLQPKESTLTEAEIEAVEKKIIAAAEKAVGASLRG